MAHAVQLTIRSGSQVTIDGQVQEVGVALTYELERADADLMQVVEEKAAEVARAHRKAWKTLRDQAVEAARGANGSDRHDAASGQAGSARPAAMPPSNTIPAPKADTALPSSTPAQHAAIRLLLEHTGLSVEEVSQTAHVSFTKEGVHILSREQASQVLLALQRAEREHYSTCQDKTLDAV